MKAGTHKLWFIIAGLLAGGSYYHWLYPPNVMKRSAIAMLESFNTAAESKDRAQVASTLAAHLAPDANIRLEVQFLALTGEGRPIVQEFPDTQSFITFIDNVLYPLSEFGYRGQLESFTMTEPYQSAELVFHSLEWGDGRSLYGGLGIEMRYSSTSECHATARYTNDKNAHPTLSRLQCKVRMRMVPKPGQASQLRDLNALSDLIKENAR
jgi:hypothetical protein